MQVILTLLVLVLISLVLIPIVENANKISTNEDSTEGGGANDRKKNQERDSVEDNQDFI
jgi:hypothetical protein